MRFFVYIVECADGTLYVGSTSDVERRIERHNEGRGCAYTSSRRPVLLLYSEEVLTLAAALAREKQIKRWTEAKKRALIERRMVDLKALAKCRTPRSRVKT